MEKFSTFLESVVIKKFAGRPKFIGLIENGEFLFYL